MNTEQIIQPILPSRYPSSHFNLDQHSSSGHSLQDRLLKLESSLPIIHDTYQRQLSSLRTEIDSLKSFIAASSSSKPTLNKNALPFIPGPTPMTPTTPHHHNKRSLLSPPDHHNPFDHLPHHEQIYSLSQQVNVLSTTMSQLLTTLLTTPNTTSLINPLTTTTTTTTPTTNTTTTAPPSPPSSLYPSHSLPNKTQPPLARNTHRHPGNLTLPSPLPPPPINNLIDSQPTLTQSRPNPHPHPHLRLRLFSPISSQNPSAASTPMSPLTGHDPSLGPVPASPINSLAGKWEQLGVSGDVLRAIVRFGVGPPSKTQQKSIPNMLLGKDLISQSNPIQERIQSYIIPALQLISNEIDGSNKPSNAQFPPSKLPSPTSINSNTSIKVLVITATLDEAAQAHRLARGIAALLPHPPKIVHCGATQPTTELNEPLARTQHKEPHLLIGTPSKLLDPVNGLRGYTFDSSFICVILDEMDQLLARNLSDMVTSLMAFLPSNSPLSPHPASQTNPNPLLLAKSDTEISSSPPTSNGPSDDWPSTTQLRQSPQNSAASSTCSGDGRLVLSGRQTCIFSCTVPQDVLAYARSLNLRVKVIVRREETNHSAACTTPSAMTPMTSNFDLGDPRTPHLTTFPWTNQSGNGNSTSTHQLLRHLSQFYYRVEPPSFTSPNPRECKLRSLIDLLFDQEVNLLRAGRGQLVIVYCNSVDSVDVVSCTLAQNNIHVIALHQDMGPAARHSLLAKFGKAARESSDDARVQSMKVLVVYDVLAKTLADISKDQPSIVINFELPRAVEDYIHRAGCIISVMNGPQARRPSTSANSQDAALINLVHAGTEIDTIKSIESFYRCKIQELRGSSHNGS